MKFSVVALLAGTAAAQVSVVTDALNSISSATSALATALQNYTPGSGASSPVVPAVTSLISAINAANSAVGPIANLNFLDSTSLAVPVTALNTTAASTISSLIDRKAVFTTDCVAGTAGRLLGEVFSAVQAFENTLQPKLDSGVAPIAQGLINGINSSFQRGIAAYQGATDCTPGGGSTTGGSSTTTTTTTTSGTAPTSGTTTGTTTSGTSAPTGTTTGTSTRPTGPIYTGAAATNYMNFGAAVMAAAAVAVL